MICPPEKRAWHAGAVKPEWWMFGNNYSIGIEIHHAVGEGYPAEQLDGVTELVLDLMGRFDIVPAEIETHRRIAAPDPRTPNTPRKVDPSDWSDAAFYAWRNSLGTQVRPLAVDRWAQVLGVPPRITEDQWRRAILRNGGGGLSIPEINYLYGHCVRLDVDPAFVLAIWVHEGGRPLGSSALQAQTFCPFNIKAAPGEHRPTVSYNGEQWLRFESAFLGMLGSILHLKNVYGLWGRLTIAAILETFAPPADNNNLEAYILSVLTDMSYMMRS